MSGFSTLPRELTDEIFYLISPTDLLNIGLTCKALYEKSIPNIRRFLKISALVGPSLSETRTKELFSKASTEASLEYLREIEVNQVYRRGEVDNRNPGPRHVYIAPNSSDGESSSKFHSREIFNTSFRHLLSQLPPEQLKKFSCSISLPPAEGYLADDFFESQTLSALFSPTNMLTTLNLSFFHSLASHCSVFHLPHLTFFTFRSYDFRDYYHVIFSILHNCQKTLKELYCNNERHPNGVLAGPSARRRREMESYMKMGYEKWKGCKKCPKGIEPPVPLTEKRIRLEELRVWRIDGMSPMMTQIFATYGLVRDAPLVDVEVSIGSLAFVKLKTSGRETLQLDRLLQYANGTPTLPDALGLEAYFKSVKGLVKVTLNFHGNVGSGWLGALKGSSETLREFHLANVFGTMILTEDEIEGLGRLLPKLEMLTISSNRTMPSCITNYEVFPRLRYFANRAYLNFDSASCKDQLGGIMRRKKTKPGFSTPLRLIRFRMPGQNFLIERDSADGYDTNEDIRIHTIEDSKMQEVLSGLGEAPKFG
ncbi:hypothetical protein TWF281_007897 [Arthrobotrys megalospora]